MIAKEKNAGVGNLPRRLYSKVSPDDDLESGINILIVAKIQEDAGNKIKRTEGSSRQRAPDGHSLLYRSLVLQGRIDLLYP